MSGDGRVRLRFVLPALAVLVVALAAIVWNVSSVARFAGSTSAAFWVFAVLALLVDAPLVAVQNDRVQMQSSLSVGICLGIFLLWGEGQAIAVQTLVGAANTIGQRYVLFGSLFATARFVVAFAAVGILADLASPHPTFDLGVTALTGPDVAWILELAALWTAVSYALLLAGPLVVASLAQTVEPAVDDLLVSVTSVFFVPLLLVALPGWWALVAAAPLFAISLSTRLRIRHEQRLHRDPVTGLCNRAGLTVQIDAITANDRVRVRPFALATIRSTNPVLDISRTLGRDVYEKILRELATRLRASYSDSTVAHLSGEAFVLLLPDTTTIRAVETATQAAAALSTPMVVDGLPFRFDCAAGVAFSPHHGRDPDGLLLKADLALDNACQQDRAVALFAPSAATVTRRRTTLISELYATLTDPRRHGEIALHYQPQVELSTGLLAGAEALVRWTHPTWGPLPPEEFIDAAETSEVIHLLTRHVVHAAAAQMRQWNDDGFPIRVAVNASAQDLGDPTFADDVATTLRAHGIHPSQLTIEITERTFLADSVRMTRAAARVAGIGVVLSLDDFGTGYASMQQLRLLPLGEVKIDRSYVSDMLTNRSARAIVTSVHQLCAALGLTFLAEGVEDERTAAVLAQLPGTVGQGWYHGQPMPPADLYHQWHHRQAPLHHPNRPAR
ncbi:bifunctional diguanylate cyclase/phosphodiesterase [Frankia sp. AgB1.9]|uniref:putative bifunctional diguanylate cyclase/phosphodiesterase n=1 Tax=unclassified Frankia TaxID=2632575 RepID=UPI0019328B25|nr:MULTISPECIES: bifunctional diguanylate cyclase/phosphodiesterase [unclassified Frankia]MBL7489771.1 bifunctional diguanylate cyclase/phosphodiesterase [Frankia sp. AgW1.1]MBL7552626.1 bifunctional diguanylate cyclase/phosphodiesterase [Frankia sp. AgB1.9]MBL7623714.1 bifunctional diguanylate cyclase/phosphodiesterase [Frankia sp. AgB1.8]